MAGWILRWEWNTILFSVICELMVLVPTSYCQGVTGPHELLSAYIKRTGRCSGLLWSSEFASDLESCVTACNSNTVCVMFTWIPSRNWCQLYDTTCEIVDEDAVETYDKRPQAPRTRLSGGPYPHEGRAEYQMDDGTWGTVCDTNYGLPHWPSVFCREAGYQRAAAAWYCDGNYAAPELPIALSDISCSPNYLFTRHCSPSGNHCGHEFDLCFTCETCKLSNLPVIPHSSTEVLGSKFQDVVAFPCLAGYQYPDGSHNQTVTCDWDETWTPAAFAACQPATTTVHDAITSRTPNKETTTFQKTTTELITDLPLPETTVAKDVRKSNCAASSKKPSDNSGFCVNLKKPPTDTTGGCVVRETTVDLLRTCFKQCQEEGPCGSFYFHNGNNTCILHQTETPAYILQTSDGWMFYG